MRSSVLVVGGGVAGPVTAMALQRAGFDVVVFEAYPAPADHAGSFLTFAGNGMDALRAIGADHRLLGQGFDTPLLVFHSGSGRRLGQVRNGAALADGTVSQTIKRADLYRSLHEEALHRGIRIEYGKRLVDAQPLPGGSVVARFGDGSEATGDLLVGADGIGSRVRRVIDPQAPSARYVPVLNTGGYARGVRVDSPPGEFRMIFGRRCFVGYIVAPNGEVWWFANPPMPTEPTPEQLAAITPEQWRARLLDLVDEDRGPARELIEATPGALSVWPTYDLPSVPHWHRGPMVLVGDAAHATSPASGQGASLAIEDGVVLAKYLRDIPGRSQALAAFESARRARVERIVAHGARSSNSKAAGPVGRVVRDLMMPFILRRMAGSDPDTSLAWMYRHHIDWDEPMTSQPSVA